jgi:hypothetical protein
MTVPEWGSLLPRAIGRAMEEELKKRNGYRHDRLPTEKFPEVESGTRN